MGAEGALSSVLRSVRLSGSLHFCLAPSGNWQSDAGPTLERMGLKPGTAVPFHIIAFPFATPHQLGNGEGGREIEPVSELPPPPWASVPTLRYNDGPNRVRVLCGFLMCTALGFKPLSDSVPDVIYASADQDQSGWMEATTKQIEHEIDQGGVDSPILERLTETMFVQMLRQHIDNNARATKGWLVAIADPPIGRCLSAIHEDPMRDWTIQDLAETCGMSRSSLSDRFLSHMNISPIRYLRDWRLHMASRALLEGNASIAAIAHDAGYGSEAAFNRAFARTYGTPPASWRQAAQASR